MVNLWSLMIQHPVLHQGLASGMTDLNIKAINQGKQGTITS